MALVDIEEDGLTISVPEERYFRFEDSRAYSSVKAQSLKEMDFGWAAQGEDVLWLLELKDYGPESWGDITDERQKLRRDLPEKITHSTLMIAAVWADTPFGKRLRGDIEQTFPNFPAQSQPVRAVAVINLERLSDRALLLGLQDAVQAAVKEMGLDLVQVLPVGHDDIRNRLGIEIKADAD
jgi:hypothetical protein